MGSKTVKVPQRVVDHLRIDMCAVRYCCFCLDGGILPEEIGLDEMCRMLRGLAKNEDGELIETAGERAEAAAKLRCSTGR